MIVYFTGLDGAGKTTVINAVSEERGRENVLVIWGRYKPILAFFFLQMARLSLNVKSSKNYNDLNEEDYASLKSHKKKMAKSDFLKQAIYLFLAGDYFFQVLWIFFRVKISDRSKLVILDRFLLDFIVDQSSNYEDLSAHWITKCYIKMLARMDKIIFLDLPIETALLRKSDIPSQAYLEDRKFWYQYYLPKLKNVVSVDASASVEMVSINVRSILDEVDRSGC